MPVARRLLTFAALLAVVFAVAAFAGGRVDMGPTGTPGHAEGHTAGGMPTAHGSDGGGHEAGGHPSPAHAEHGGADPVRGLAVSEDGLTLELGRTDAPLGERFTLAFRIRDGRGATVRDFDVEHTRRMHLILVRRDLTGFQHLHPVQEGDGSWTVPATITEPGAYRVFADFSADGTPRTLGADLPVDGSVSTVPLPAPERSVDLDGLEVTRAAGGVAAGEEAELEFEVTRDGEPVDVAPYLGAQGHLVALREGDLAFLHVHPDADRLRFAATLPSAGRYRLFLQFRTGGEVHTAAFTEDVSR